MTVRGPEGPPGPPGSAEFGNPASGSGDMCGCNQTLLRMYVKEMNPILVPGPPGNPGPPVRIFSEDLFTLWDIFN